MRANFICLCGLLVLVTPMTNGCGDGSENPVVPPVVPQVDTITIDPQPDSVNAPWQITGPSAFSQSGTGDLTLANMAAGRYT
jgi:hypothetical protein